MRKSEAFQQKLFTFHSSLFTNHYGGVAQLGEHLPCKQGVMGSIPIISTKGERGKEIHRELNGLIAQVVRARAWEARGRWFESTWAHQTTERSRDQTEALQCTAYKNAVRWRVTRGLSPPPDKVGKYVHWKPNKVYWRVRNEQIRGQRQKRI